MRKCSTYLHYTYIMYTGFFSAPEGQVAGEKGRREGEKGRLAPTGSGGKNWHRKDNSSEKI